ncbi:hypothetical protein HDV05_007395 [Chytridiales sp. JEL 0842]|nr:hypothetical protein HDV05_007395 [Chytridiales sp. JEL 0842]
MALPYGVDGNLRCVWSLEESMYNLIKLSLNRQASYTCRVPISKDATLFWPLTFSFWGMMEEDGKEGSTVMEAELLAAAGANGAAEGNTIPASNPQTSDQIKSDKNANRPIIAPSVVKPVSRDQLPTVAALLASVPKTVVFMYVLISVGSTAGVAVLLYLAYLKPKLLETKKKK